MSYLLALFLLLGQAGKTPAVKYIPAKDVHAAAQKLGTKIIDQGTYSAIFGKRTTGGQVEVHTEENDIFYVVEGSATFIIGGTVVDGKPSGPGEIRGASITGGQTIHLTKGDVIHIPKTVPHWFKSVEQPFAYFIVKTR